MSRPKPGDPDFVPRYPRLDLAPIEQRIVERDETSDRISRRVVPYEQAASVVAQAEAIRSDTDMMRELLVEVKNLRLANEGLKEVIAALRGTGT